MQPPLPPPPPPPPPRPIEIHIAAQPPAPVEAVPRLTPLDVCFFLMIVLGFGAVVYLLSCALVTTIEGNDDPLGTFALVESNL